MGGSFFGGRGVCRFWGGGEDVRGRRAAAKWEWARGRQKRIGIEGERAKRAVRRWEQTGTGCKGGQ